MAIYNSNVKDYLYTWKIENFEEKNDVLESPSFKVDILENTEWKLLLYPDGYKDEEQGVLKVFLHRITETETNVKDIRIQFTFSIIAKNVSFNISKKIPTKLFGPNTNYGFTRFISRETLLLNKNVYLPQNILTIQCYMVDKTHFKDDTMFDDFKHVMENNSIPETLNQGLLRLYLDSELCDVQICTNDKTFSVHKTVLCASSPVFLAMFKSETKEKTSGCIDITDIDSETIGSMLMFMYSNSIEQLNQDQAAKLYTAAEKYGILPLKQKCSSLLKSFLSDENVCEIYTLGDLFQDVDLKASAENYIFVYSNRIFKSSEWENFMKLKPELTSRIMHKLWIKHLDI